MSYDTISKGTQEIIQEARREGAIQALKDAAEFATSPEGQYWFPFNQATIEDWLIDRADRIADGEIL